MSFFYRENRDNVYYHKYDTIFTVTDQSWRTSKRPSILSKPTETFILATYAGLARHISAELKHSSDDVFFHETGCKLSVKKNLRQGPHQSHENARS